MNEPNTPEPQAVDAQSNFVFVVPEEFGKAIWETTGANIIRGAYATGPDQLVFELPNGELYVDGNRIEFKSWTANTTFFPTGEGLLCPLPGKELILELDLEARLDMAQTFEQMKQRNALAGFTAPIQDVEPTSKPKAKLPKSARQGTFIEARSVSHALSNAPHGTNWRDIDGANALLHKGMGRGLDVRFEPTERLLNHWGNTTPTKQALRDALKRVDFETNITFQMVLACILETPLARRSFTLGELIKLIGRDTDARRSSAARQKLELEVWENILTLTSLPIIGARGGNWLEPAPNGEKGAKMALEKLTSRDPLLVITGVKDSPNSVLPRQFSLTAGEWLMPHIGNRKFLEDFGDVLKIATISRGKVSGAWAACVGLALQQKWREQASKAQKNRASRGKETKVEVLKFRPFTRRELLMQVFQCDDQNSPNTILNDPKGRRQRAEEYWKAAIEELKSVGLVGYYREVTALDGMNTNDLNEAWLDQPLDIRPTDKFLADALAIHKAALEAKARAKRSGKSAPKKELPE